jgi:predicted methyltransferase
MAPLRSFLGLCLVLTFSAILGTAQEKSINPKINDPFKDPDIEGFLKAFEGESREIFALRKEILKQCQIKPGMMIADIGAGTGLFTRMFADAVGETGKIYAVEIAQKFLDHIEKTCKEAKITNVQTVLCSHKSTELKENSTDLVFICDTYHHFEFPERTLASIHKALKPKGRIILIDFQRIKGKSRDWIINHVRASQEVFTKEIESAGFKAVREENFLKENYFVEFTKLEKTPENKK